MNIQKSTLALLVVSLLVSCGLFNSDSPVLIDGQPVNNQLFFTFIDSSEYYQLSPDKQYRIARRFATLQLAADKLGDKYDANALEGFLENKTNDLIIKSVMDAHIREQATDSVKRDILLKRKVKKKVKEILFTHYFSSGYRSDRMPEQALVRAEKARHRVSSQEIRFGDAVTIYTEIPSMEIKGGSYGFIPYQDLPKNVLDAAWATGVGGLTGPIKSQYGYHLLWIGEEMPVADFDTTAEYAEINAKLTRGGYGFVDDEMRKLADRLFREHDVELRYQNLADLFEMIEADRQSKEKYPLQKLEGVVFEKELARIGSQSVDLKWVLERSYLHGAIARMSVHTPYILYRAVNDIITRSLVIDRALEQKQVDLSSFEDELELHEMQFLADKFFKTKKENDKTITDDVIVNRLLLNHTIKLNTKQ